MYFPLITFEQNDKNAANISNTCFVICGYFHTSFNKEFKRNSEENHLDRKTF